MEPISRKRDEMTELPALTRAEADWTTLEGVACWALAATTKTGARMIDGRMLKIESESERVKFLFVLCVVGYC